MCMAGVRSSVSELPPNLDQMSPPGWSHMEVRGGGGGIIRERVIYMTFGGEGREGVSG